jgi:hypothetical protein
MIGLEQPELWLAYRYTPTPILIGFKQPNYDLEYPHRYDRFKTYTMIYVYRVNKIDRIIKILS